MADSLLTILEPERSLLVAVAAPREAEAVLAGLTGVGDRDSAAWTIRRVSSRVDLVLTGVGKSNAAGAVSRCFDASRHGGVLNIGVAGALPRSGLELCESVCASWSLLADEGLQTEDGFRTLASMGFPPGPKAIGDPGSADGAGFPADAGMLACARSRTTAVGSIATVSTCAGTQSIAQTIRSRTGALCEAMEGAAIACALARIDATAGDDAVTPFLEVRVISNTTGDRASQVWDLEGALTELGGLVGSLVGPVDA